MDVSVRMLAIAVVAASVALAARPAEAVGRADARAACRSTQLIAHRGMADRRHTENTIRTFQRAYAHDVRSLETDARLTADGQWVLMHDVTVDRTTHGSGVVRELSLAQIRSLRTNDGVVGGVPLLGQALWLVGHRRGMRLQIEIKSYDADETALRSFAAQVRHYGVARRVTITSYSADVLRGLRRVDPSLSTGLVTVTQLPASTVREVAGTVVLQRGALSRAYVAQMHAGGVRVHTWTVNRKREWRLAVQARVDTIITNSPPRLRKLCGRR